MNTLTYKTCMSHYNLKQLEKEVYWSKLNQSLASDKAIERTNSIIRKYKLTNGQQLTMLYMECDVLLLPDVFENCVKMCTEKYTISPFIQLFTARLYLEVRIKINKHCFSSYQR